MKIKVQDFSRPGAITVRILTEEQILYRFYETLF